MKILERKKRRRFGQHFLKDESIAEKIVSFAYIEKNETVLEIGPGKGILTSIILEQAEKTIAVEVDDRLIRYLKKRFAKVENLHLVHRDFLKYDIPLFSEKIKVIGNLPYSAGTKIIKYLMNQRDRFSEMIFMLQKEVAERLVASPGTKDYGSLSIFIQIHFDASILLNISPDAFSPPPKVHSALVKLTPKKQLVVGCDDSELFQKIVKLAFSNRRKKLRNNLKALPVGEHDFKEISRETGINFDQRGEMLSIEEYLRLTKSINKLQQKNHVAF